jgi:hypothetical protein
LSLNAENIIEYERLIDVFRAHDIGYFFYNGGGDSQDTAYEIRKAWIDESLPKFSKTGKQFPVLSFSERRQLGRIESGSFSRNRVDYY